MLRWIFLAITIWLTGIGQPAAEEELVTGKFVVSLVSQGDQRQWVVNALEQNIYNDLSGYARVVPVQKLSDELSQCPERNSDCLLKLYRKLGIDALLLGVVDESEIDYETYDVQNGFLVATGSIKIGSGSSLLQLRIGAFHAFRTFLRKGGILDDRAITTESEETGPVENESEETDLLKKASLIGATEAGQKFRIQLLIGLAVFTCLPLLLSFLGRGFVHPERSKAMARGFYLFTVLSVVPIGYQYYLESHDGGNIFNIFLGLFEGQFWILAGLGGAVWGYFLILLVKIVIPQLQGIERIEQYNLVPLLRSCLVVSVIKLALVAGFYAPVFTAVVYLGHVFSVTQDATIVLLIPLAGMYVLLWMALMLDVFSMSIDVKLSGRKFDYNSAWNLKIRNYFIGYLKRNGITLNRELVDQIVFLPGEHKGVVCYRGGFSKPRIAIEKDLLVFALGDVDETEPEESIAAVMENYNRKYVEPELRQHGILQVTPTLVQRHSQRKSRLETWRDKKRAKRLEAIQKSLQYDLAQARDWPDSHKCDLRMGHVFPVLQGSKDITSLMADSHDDMRIIQDMLLEYSRRRDRYDHDAEVDTADEHDMDFLFGAMLHKCGSLLRHDDVFSTIKLFLLPKKRIREGEYKYFVARHFSIVADTFVVLNFGLNHLIQHLYYKATQDPSYLTCKGAPGLMLKNQADILMACKERIEQRTPRWFEVDELDRITWLSRFGQESIDRDSHAELTAKRLLRLALLTSFVGAAALVTLNAFLYNPIYQDIIEMEKQEIAEAIAKE